MLETIYSYEEYGWEERVVCPNQFLAQPSDKLSLNNGLKEAGTHP
jgi:hypothetical protein